MNELSPAAQAVLNAANGACCYGPDDVLNDSRWIAAAALRAAITSVGAEEILSPDSSRTEGVKWCVRRIFAIADELDPQ